MKKPRQAAHSNQQISVQKSYSGPIPPASELAHYNSVVDGAAERILAMAEKSQSHQADMDIKALNAMRREVRRGQIFGLIITTFAFSVCILAMFMSHPSVAAIIGGTTVVGLAVAFVTGHKK